MPTFFLQFITKERCVNVKYVAGSVLGVITLASLLVTVNGSVHNNYYDRAFPITAEIPEVILEHGTAGTSTIYMNDTSAAVSVPASTPNYDYVLKITNQATTPWNASVSVFNSSNIERISNATIGFHDGSSSNQIIVNNGSITQSEGEPYDLSASSTIYVTITDLQAGVAGTSYLYVYLKILLPSTSTFNLLTITFEIT
jgi:hypothetical protein